jgi:hypothetical protein
MPWMFALSSPDILLCPIPGKIRRDLFQSYQLIRGVLAAAAGGLSFCVLCDARHPDLIEDWYRIARAVQSAELRSRMRVLTWQELASGLAPTQRKFLREK